MEILVYHDAPYARRIVLCCVTDDILLEQCRKRELLGFQRPLPGRVDEGRKMPTLAPDGDDCAPLRPTRIDPVILAQRDDREMSGAVQRQQPFYREMRNGRIFIDEHGLQIAVEALERLLLKMRHDQSQHLVHAQDRIAPGHGIFTRVILACFGKIYDCPLERIGRDTFGEIAFGEVFKR